MDIADARLQDDAECRYVIFIDGISLCWTTDTGQGHGGIQGSGIGTWMGMSEEAIAGIETVGDRDVRQGLIMPRTLSTQQIPKLGELQPSPAVFGLMDDDAGTVAGLFAREGKEFDILRRRQAPGTTALPANTVGQGDLVIGLWNRNVGLERVGAAGERRLFPYLPFTLSGWEHPVHQDQAPPGGLPPIKVSDQPLQFVGRRVSVYRVYRDPDEPESTGPGAWYTWDEQHAAGNLVWWGTLAGVKRTRGKSWELRVEGPDSLLRRQMGVSTTDQTQPMTAELAISGDQTLVSIVFVEDSDIIIPTLFDSSVFDRSVTEVTKVALAAEINGFIQDALDGTDTNFTDGNGDFEDWQVVAVDQEPRVSIASTGVVTIRKNELAADQVWGAMYLVLESSVWRQLGFEPETQNFNTSTNPPESELQIKFRKLVFGADYDIEGLPLDPGVLVVPNAIMWEGKFTTVEKGFTETVGDSNQWDNDSKDRNYEPKFPGEPFTILKAAGQILRMSGGISPYVEGQLTVPAEGSISATTCDRSRFFAITGKIFREGLDEEGIDTTQVFRCSWVEGPNYGGVDPVGGAVPALLTNEMQDPRIWGFNNLPLDRDWVGLGTGEGALSIVPLNAYPYLLQNSPEFVHSVMTQIMLSSGSGTGYVGGVLAPGDNSVGALPFDLFFGDDLELADLGLAIESLLVAPLDEFKDAFNANPGGWNGPLNRVRYDYRGPFKAQDIFSSILPPRRMMWRLHGAKYSLVKLASFSPEDADITINQRDVYSDGDTDSLIPEQNPNPDGHLDKVELAYRLDPHTNRPTLSRTERAADSEARARTGEGEVGVTDFGLTPIDFGTDILTVAGISSWFDDFRQLWAYDAAEFFARDHYAIVIRISRPKAQDIRLGTKILLNNPWPQDNAGSYGLVNHVGVLVGVTIDTDSDASLCEIFVFAGQAEGSKHFAPMCRILDQAGVAVTVSRDQYGHGDTSIRDYDGMVEPDWSNIGDQVGVQVLIREGESYFIGTSHRVVSVDHDTDIITLDSIPDVTHEYADRWLMLVTHDGQSPDQYPRTIFGVIVLDDLTHGPGSLTGRPFV